MKKLWAILGICVLMVGVSACSSHTDQEPTSDEYVADLSFLDDIYVDDYMIEDRDAVRELCNDCEETMSQVESDQAYNQTKQAFYGDLANYDSIKDLAAYYESALHGYVDNFDDSAVNKSKVYALYDDMKDNLYESQNKQDFYNACVDIDDAIEEDFGITPRPSMDVRLYMEDRNLSGKELFDRKATDGKDKDKNNGSIWPENGAYVDYEGNTYATREEVQEAVNSGKISGYYYLYSDGRVDSTVPISDEVLDKYKEKYGNIGDVDDD